MKLDLRHLYLKSNVGRYLKETIMGNMIIREITGETEQRNMSLFFQSRNIPEVYNSVLVEPRTIKHSNVNYSKVNKRILYAKFLFPCCICNLGQTVENLRGQP